MPPLRRQRDTLHPSGGNIGARRPARPHLLLGLAPHALRASEGLLRPAPRGLSQCPGHGHGLRRNHGSRQPGLVETILHLIEVDGEPISATPLRTRLVDRDDEPFLEVALAARVEALVTEREALPERGGTPGDGPRSQGRSRARQGAGRYPGTVKPRTIGVISQPPRAGGVDPGGKRYVREEERPTGLSWFLPLNACYLSPSRTYRFPSRVDSTRPRRLRNDSDGARLHSSRVPARPLTRSRAALGPRTVTGCAASFGKCFAFPVTSASTRAARATSRNGSSSRSTSRVRSGVAEIGSPSTSMR